MKPSLQRVLDRLREKKRKGISFSDFPAGTELRKRLAELRDSGFKLKWQWEDQMNGGRYKRWWLIGEPK